MGKRMFYELILPSRPPMFAHSAKIAKGEGRSKRETNVLRIDFAEPLPNALKRGYIEIQVSDITPYSGSGSFRISCG